MQAAIPYRHKRINRKDLVFYTFLLLFSVFMIASSLSEPLKYLKYSLPLLLLLVLMSGGKIFVVEKTSLQSNQRLRYLNGFLLFYFIACGINILKGFSNPRFYQELYFILSPLVFALFLFFLRPVKDYSKAIVLLFWGISAAFVAEKFPFFLEEIKHPSLLVDAFLTSELPTESNYAFEFGLFFLVFLKKRNQQYAFLSFVLLLLSFKRIAIAGVFLVIILFLLRKYLGWKLMSTRSKFLILFANCVVVSMLFLFFAGTFDELIEENLGVSSNFLTQGRYNIYQDIFRHFGKIDILGFGLGSINRFLSATGYELVNLHSDLLKVFFELGPVFFVAWIYFFYRRAITFLSVCLALYMNVLFLTDNVFIYFDVMFVFYIVMLDALQMRNRQGQEVPVFNHPANPLPAA